MKFKLTILLLLGCILSGCENDDSAAIPKVEGLSLYWDHEVFGKEGRRLRFEFFAKNRFDQQHELLFNYRIEDRSIIITLEKSVNNGPCQYLPMPSAPPNDPSKCLASGGVFIPEDKLKPGTYSLQLSTPFFGETSQLVVSNEKIMLNIPQNEHFTSQVNEVYPLPADVLFGSVGYTGNMNGIYADSFLNDLANLGLEKAILPVYPYKHLAMDQHGNAIERHWEPDHHSLGFIYHMKENFKPIFEVAQKHFNSSRVNIYLFSSNGDQASLDQYGGIHVNFAE